MNFEMIFRLEMINPKFNEGESHSAGRLLRGSEAELTSVGHGGKGINVQAPPKDSLESNKWEILSGTCTCWTAGSF